MNETVKRAVVNSETGWKIPDKEPLEAYVICAIVVTMISLRNDRNCSKSVTTFFWFLFLF